MKIKSSPGRVLTILALLIIAGFPACKKNNSADTEQQKEEFADVTSQSDAETEVVFNDVFDNIMGVNDEVALGGTGIFGSAYPGGGVDNEIINGTGQVDSNTCYTVTITQLSAIRFPLQVVIDFGAGCTGRDGRTRKGRIVIVYTGRLVIPGNSATATFDGYAIDDVSVEGSYKVTNTGTLDVKSFTIEVSNAKLSKPNGDFSQWNSTRTITQVEGAATPLIALDDVFTITGKANGSIMKGDKFFQWATNISEPLVKKFACHWIVKGTITIKKSNTAVAVLDYGSGGCDNLATFTVNGTVHEITLH